MWFEQIATTTSGYWNAQGSLAAPFLTRSLNYTKLENAPRVHFVALSINAFL